MIIIASKNNSPSALAIVSIALVQEKAPVLIALPIVQRFIRNKGASLKRMPL